MKYFIGGISRDVTTTESLRAYFEIYGEVADAVVMIKDGQSRGFGFVTYADANQLPSDFSQIAHLVDGKQVDVKPAVPEEELRSSMPAIKKLFIGGLTPTTTQDHLVQYFSQFGTLTDAVVMIDPAGHPRGFGFVTYEDATQAEMACGFGQHSIDGKVVDVKIAEPKGSPSLAARPLAPGAYGSAPYGYGAPPQYGAAVPQYAGGMSSYGKGMGAYAPPGPMRGGARPFRQVAHSPNAGSTEHPHSHGAKLFVGGISHDTTENSMMAYFSQFGTVVACEVMRREGISRGFGFVVFTQDDEASYALSQPMHVIDGKQVECKPCQPKGPEPPMRPPMRPYRPGAARAAVGYGRGAAQTYSAGYTPVYATQPQTFRYRPY